MMRLLRSIRGVPVTTGGVGHSGWLPKGASMPLPTPIENLVLDLSISTDGTGFFLESSDLSGRCRGDTWHQTIEDAINTALETFGVAAADWHLNEQQSK